MSTKDAAAKPVPFDAKKLPPEAPQLGAGALEGAEFVRNHWCAKVEHGVQFEAILAPEFWAHHAYQLKPWDHIEARADDGTWYAELVVADTSRNWARVVPILGPIRMTTQDQSLTAASNLEVETEKKKYRAQFRNQHKWCVVRIADSALIEQDIADKEATLQKIEEIARKAVGAPPKMKAPASAEAPA